MQDIITFFLGWKTFPGNVYIEKAESPTAALRIVSFWNMRFLHMLCLFLAKNRKEHIACTKNGIDLEKIRKYFRRIRILAIQQPDYGNKYQLSFYSFVLDHIHNSLQNIASHKKIYSWKIHNIENISKMLIYIGW